MFDVAHINAFHDCKPDSKNFLLEHRKKGRPGEIPGLGIRKRKRTVTTTSGTQVKTLPAYPYQRKALEPAQSGDTDTTTTTEPNTSTSRSELENTKDPEYVPKEKTGVGHVKKKKDFINEKIVAIFDSCKISDPCGVRTIIAVAESLGHDVNTLTVSRVSFQV